MRPAQNRPAARKAWGDLVATRQPEFALEMPPAPPEEPLDVCAIVGQAKATSTRRVLLDAVPLPMPVSMNEYWQTRVVWSEKQNRHMAIVYPSKEAKAYQETIRGMMLERKAWYRTEQPLEMRVLLCFKDNRLSDLDNRIKPLQDALAYGNLFQDDLQIRHLEVRQGPNLKPAICYVTLIEVLPDRIGNRDWIKAGPTGDDHGR